MPYELIPMACAAVAALGFAAWSARSGGGARVVFGTTLMIFAALTLAGSMALHSGEILYNAVNGIEVVPRAQTPQADILGFRYDFRFYSLQLFSGVLIFWSTRLALSAVRLVRGIDGASKAASWNIAYVTMLVFPLVPMHIFAVATVTFMAIASLGWYIARPLAAPEDALVFDLSAAR